MVSKKTQWTEYRPSAHVTEYGPIEFLMSGPGKHFIDYQNTRLYIKGKIFKPDGSDFPNLKPPDPDPNEPITPGNWNPEHNVGPVTLWLHCLFS